MFISTINNGSVYNDASFEDNAKILQDAGYVIDNIVAVYTTPIYDICVEIEAHDCWCYKHGVDPYKTQCRFFIRIKKTLEMGSCAYDLMRDHLREIKRRLSKKDN